MDNVWFFITRSLPIWVKWLLLALGFFFIEPLHTSWVVLWFGLGALAATLVALIFPDAVPYQIAIFFVVSTLLVVFARRITLAILFPMEKIEILLTF